MDKTLYMSGSLQKLCFFIKKIRYKYSQAMIQVSINIYKHEKLPLVADV